MFAYLGDTMKWQVGVFILIIILLAGMLVACNGGVVGVTEIVIDDYFVVNKYELKGKADVLELIEYTGNDSSIVIPEGINIIARGCFSNNDNITSIKFPRSLSEIYSSFNNCKNLKDVDFSAIIKLSNVNYSFNSCDAIEKLVFPIETLLIEESFMHCNNLSDIEFSNTIKTIGRYSFSESKKLKEVTLPEGLTTIGNGAFCRCSYLNKVHFPSTLQTMRAGAFAETNLSDISMNGENDSHMCVDNCLILKPEKTLVLGTSKSVIPDDGSVEKIKGDAFSGSLTRIVIPQSIVEIAPHAFDCPKLLEVCNESVLEIKCGSSDHGGVGMYARIVHNDRNKSYTFDEQGVTYFANEGDKVALNYTNIGEHLVFARDTVEIADKFAEPNDILKTVDIPDGVVSIGSEAFFGSTALEQVSLSFSAKVLTINEGAFQGCSSLEEITIPNATQTISERAFYGCSNMKQVYISADSDLRTIEYDAFSDCRWLTRFVLPEKLEKLESSRGCYRMVEVVNLSSCKANDASFSNLLLEHNDINYNGLTVEEDGAVLYSKDKHTYYIGSYIQKEVVDIPEETTIIRSYAFYEDTTIKQVNLPSTLTAIGREAFAGCTSLMEVDFSNTDIKEIEDDAFSECTSLTKVEFGNVEIETIRSGAFEGCTSIKEVNTDNLFTWCGISFAGRTSNPAYLSGCLSVNGKVLKSLTIPNKVYNIGNYSFAGNKVLEKVVLPWGVATIGKGAFLENEALCDLTMAHSISDIGEEAFKECVSLEKVTLPNYLRYLRKGAFSDCYNLYEINFNEELWIIYEEAFKNCEALTAVVFPESVERIGARVFEGCISLDSVQFTNTTGWQYFTSLEDWSHLKNGISCDISEDGTTNADLFLTEYLDLYFIRRLI